MIRLATVLFALSLNAYGATYYVSQSTANGYAVGNDTNNGTAKSTPFLTVMKAHTAAASGDTIVINDGLYLTGDGPNGATSFNITKSITVNGETNLGATIRGTHTTQNTLITVPSTSTVTLGAIVLDANNVADRCVSVADTSFTPTIVLNGTKLANCKQYGIHFSESNANFQATNAEINTTFAVTGGIGINRSAMTSGDVTINGLALNLTYASAGAFDGIILTSTTGTGSTVSISGVTGTMTTGNNANGISVKSIPNAVIENSNFTISSSLTTGSVIGARITTSGGVSANGGIIRNNTIVHDADTGYAIMIGESGNNATENNKANNGKIYGNVVTRPRAYSSSRTPHGIVIGPNTGGEVYRNTVVGEYVCILLSKTDSTTSVHNNYCRNAFGRGIYLKGANGTKILNNTSVVLSGYAVYTDSAQLHATNHGDTQEISQNVEFKSNIAYTTENNQKFLIASELFAGWGQPTIGSADYNWYYSSGTAASTPWIYQTSTYANFAAWQGAGLDAHGVSGTNPSIVLPSAAPDVAELSPVIDAGTNTGVTADFYGYPIWGTPDIGAVEYQPPYTIGTDGITAPSARIYSGDLEGRFRATSASTRACALEISPSGGAWNDLGPTDVRPVFADVSSLTCPNSARTTLTLTPAGSITPRVRVKRLPPNTPYEIRINGALAGSAISGCPSSKCLSDDTGTVEFTWASAIATAKSIDVRQYAPRGGGLMKHPNQ